MSVRSSAGEGLWSRFRDIWDRLSAVERAESAGRRIETRSVRLVRRDGEEVLLGADSAGVVVWDRFGRSNRLHASVSTVPGGGMAFGDSIAAGLLGGSGWPTLLGAVNAAVPGQRWIGSYSDEVGPVGESASGAGGGYVILHAGINDLTLGHEPGAVADAAEDTIVSLRERFYHVFVCTVLPVAGPGPSFQFPNEGEAVALNENVRLLNDLLAERFGPTDELIDFRGVLDDASGYLAETWDAGDGLHVNGIGQVRLAEVAASQVNLNITHTSLTAAPSVPDDFTPEPEPEPEPPECTTETVDAYMALALADPDLQAFWAMQDEDAPILDAVAGADGSPSGTVTYREEGPFECVYAVRFATGHFNTEGIGGGEELTVHSWVYAEGEGTLWSGEGWLPGEGWRCFVTEAGAIAVESEAGLSVTGPTVTGGWHHVATVFSGLSVSLVVDGTLIGTDTDATAGSIGDGPSAVWRCALMGVSARALTPSELAPFAAFSP